jgi:dynein heavy chain, axonemal
VQLVRALRNPGMCDRHWDNISKELSIDLHPDDSFTLAQALDLDLLNDEKLKTVVKVSDIAGMC